MREFQLPRLRWLTLLAIVAVAMVSAGCGSSESGDSSGTSGSGSSASGGSGGSSGVAEAKKIVEQYSKAPTSVGVTTPLKKKPETGKVVYYVACCGPAAEFMINEGKAAADALGWTFKPINTKGTPESLKAGWDQAAADPDTAAVLGNGVPVVLIKDALDKLEKKKAVAITWANVDEPNGSLIAVLGNKPFIQQVGDMLAAWMVADTDGKANATIFTVPSLPILPPLTDEFQKKMKELCPSCKANVVPEPITAVGADMPSRISGYLQAHPDVNYITAGWDDMLIGVPPALQSAGLGTKVKAVGYAPGSTANAGYVKNGQVEKALIPYPYAEIVWRSFDILARQFNGESIEESAKAPLPLTFATADTIDDPGQLLKIIPDYQDQYKKLWGVN
jgi:ABC-type sugar transport system substrate-binding protein